MAWKRDGQVVSGAVTLPVRWVTAPKVRSCLSWALWSCRNPKTWENNTKIVLPGSELPFHEGGFSMERDSQNWMVLWMPLGSFGKPAGRGGAGEEDPEPLCSLLPHSHPQCHVQDTPGQQGAEAAKSLVCVRERERGKK